MDSTSHRMGHNDVCLRRSTPTQLLLQHRTVRRTKRGRQTSNVGNRCYTDRIRTLQRIRSYAATTTVLQTPTQQMRQRQTVSATARRNRQTMVKRSNRKYLYSQQPSHQNTARHTHHCQPRTTRIQTTVLTTVLKRVVALHNKMQTPQRKIHADIGHKS